MADSKAIWQVVVRFRDDSVHLISFLNYSGLNELPMNSDPQRGSIVAGWWAWRGCVLCPYSLMHVDYPCITSAWTRAISLLCEEKSVCFHLPRKLRAESRRKQHRRLATLHLICLFMYVLHERLKIALNCARIILGDKTYSPSENGHYLFIKLSYSIILPLFH